eukprot:24649-Rhodomonas_salina.2
MSLRSLPDLQVSLQFCLLLSLWLYGAVMIMLVIAVLQGGSQVFIMAFLGPSSPLLLLFSSLCIAVPAH